MACGWPRLFRDGYFSLALPLPRCPQPPGISQLVAVGVPVHINLEKLEDILPSLKGTGLREQPHVGATRIHLVKIRCIAFFSCCDQKPNRNILTEKEFVLSHSFRDTVHEDLVDFLVVGVHGGSSSHYGRSESKERAAEMGDSVQRPVLVS